MSSKTKSIKFIGLTLAAIFAAAAGMYLVEKLYLGPMREQKQIMDNLVRVVEELTRDVRVAEVFVLDQSPEPLTTTFRFVEVDSQGERIAPPKEFTIAGDVAYFDSLVIKFQDSYDPATDLPVNKEALRALLSNRAVILFRRVFGEKQKPEDGFLLDVPGRAPEAYELPEPPTLFVQRLWDEFWQLATDPKLAQEHGVRAAHGQAVYTKLRPGMYYVLERRLTGDLTIRPVELPAVIR